MTFYATSDRLQILGDRLLQRVWSMFPELQPEQLALTWLLYPQNPKLAAAQSPTPWGYDYRGLSPVYPASVVKLFYLVMVHESVKTGRLQWFPELERATRDMIVDSSNDATGFVMDVLTETTAGPDLPDAEFDRWQVQRNRINRYFHALGWPELHGANLNQKTWCDGSYGRERSFLGQDGANRNALTTAGTARLFHTLVTGQILGLAPCEKMLTLLARDLDPVTLAANPENQVTGFLGGGLPQTARLWSKAGLMSRVRHDAAYVEIPDRPPVLLVVFTEGPSQSQNERLLPFIAEQVVAILDYGWPTPEG